MPMEAIRMLFPTAKFRIFLGEHETAGFALQYPLILAPRSKKTLKRILHCDTASILCLFLVLCFLKAYLIFRIHLYTSEGSITKIKGLE